MEETTPQPAVKMSNLNELTPQEFQKMLQSWFKEKGLENDLRLYIRLQMISILKNTELGQKLNKPLHQTTPLTQQAMNLIVAEYLIKNNYHYTYSVFNTEVNLGVIFPNLGELFLQMDKLPQNQRTIHFDESNFLNILELIGVGKTTEESKELCQIYYSGQERKTILTCLISLLCKYAQEKFRPDNKTNQHYLQLVDINKEDQFILNIVKMVSKTSLPSHVINDLISEIKKYYSQQKEYIQDDYTKKQAELRNQLLVQENKFKDCNKTKKQLEKRYKMLYEDHKKVSAAYKKAVENEQALREQHEAQISKLTTKFNDQLTEYTTKIQAQCNLKHCDSSCEENVQLVNTLNADNRKVLQENEFHKMELKKLSSKCSELLCEFTSRSKMDSKLLEGHDTLDNMPFSSLYLNDQSGEQQAEEILKNTRMKLMELEIESAEIDKRLSKTLR